MSESAVVSSARPSYGSISSAYTASQNGTPSVVSTIATSSAAMASTAKPALASTVATSTPGPAPSVWASESVSGSVPASKSTIFPAAPTSNGAGQGSWGANAKGNAKEKGSIGKEQETKDKCKANAGAKPAVKAKPKTWDEMVEDGDDELGSVMEFA